MILESSYCDATLTIAHLENATAGETFTSEIPFLIFNASSEAVDATIHPVKNDDAIETTLFPGWTPILCDSVEVPDGASIQIGY